MPHVDDGQLHALLDGAFDDREARSLHAHLETCAQCATRLEQERALRERASGILAAAQPMRLITPPFDAVQQEARQRSTRPVFWTVPARLAWAATTVVALGLGWFANDLLRLDNARREQAAEAFSAPPPAAPVPSPAPEPPPAANDAAGARVAEVGRFQNEDEKDKLARDQRSIKAQERAAVERLDAMRKQAPAARDSSPREQALNLNEVVVTGSVAALVDSSARLRMAQTVTPQGAGRAAQAAQQAQAPVQALQQIAKSEATLRWESMSAELAQARTGQKVLLVPGLRVIDISVATLGNTFQVRAVQELPGGELLEVRQQPITPAPPQAAAVANDQVARRAALDRLSVEPVVVQRDGLTLTGRADIAQDSLRILLLRAR